jgi:hypothetical protein
MPDGLIFCMMPLMLVAALMYVSWWVGRYGFPLQWRGKRDMRRQGQRVAHEEDIT